MSCSKRCLRCKYSKKFGNLGKMANSKKISKYESYYCDYISMVGNRRPCKAGDECTVFQGKQSRRAKKDKKSQ